MKIRKIIDLVIITLFLLFVNACNVFASGKILKSPTMEENLLKSYICKILLIIFGISIFVMVILIISTMFKNKTNNTENESTDIDYEECLEIIKKKRRFIDRLVIIMVFFLPIIYFSYVFYANFTSHLFIIS